MEARAGAGLAGSGRVEPRLGVARLSWRSSVQSDWIVDRLGFQRADDLSDINRKGLGTGTEDAESAQELAEGARMVGYWIAIPLSTKAWISEIEGVLREEAVAGREPFDSADGNANVEADWGDPGPRIGGLEPRDCG